MKKNKLVYVLLPILLLCISALLEIWTDDASCMAETNANFTYFSSCLCALMVIAGLFVSIRCTNMHPVARMLFLFVPALAVLLDYYLLMDTNLLYALPLMAIAYIFVYPKNKKESSEA